MEPSPKTIGVLILNTTFPRLPGDIGNPDSFKYPVIYQSIHSATPASVVTNESLAANVEADIKKSTLELADKNVSLITTSCGFLSPMQTQLARLTSTPVITSSLALLPLLGTCHGGAEHLGVLTFDKTKLNTRHLADSMPGAIEGLDSNDTLKHTIAQDLPHLDKTAALREVLAASNRLMLRKPALRAIILECTNLSPYKKELRSHTGIPVYDIVDAVHWLLEATPDSAK